VPPACPISGGKLVYFGYGIQRVEQELRRKFPEARLARMDSDTMTSPQQFRELFDRFSAGELDLLLGTQMVGKGLDFPRVSLVGVVSADTALSIPDFRASERTFQLIVQVAGRAGRSDLPGEVIVQTLYPEEPAVELATRHDYEGFAAVELPAREQMALPPATRLVRLLVRHAESQRAEAAAGQLADRLRALLPEEVELTGPMPCGVIRLRNLFRFQVLLSCRRAGRIQQVLQPHMDALVRELPAELLADADPVQLI
jgi:primosomal protein N' (replication factor Y)